MLSVAAVARRGCERGRRLVLLGVETRPGRALAFLSAGLLDAILARATR